MKKAIAATAIAATTLGGVAAGATLFVPGQAGAQDSAPAEEATPGSHLSDALQGLVDDGTITESQRDAVVSTLEAARAERGGDHGNRGPGIGADLGTILGLDREEIGAALQDGQSIADLAAQQGVDTSEIVDAIVSATEERVAGALESGRIDQDKADEILAGAEDHANDVVNGDAPIGRGGRGPGHGPRDGGPGFGGPGADAPADAAA